MTESKISDEYFYFKKFKLRNKNAALKVNTDGVLLGAWVNLNGDKKVLDVGTGSGVIALMLNQRFSLLEISAIDIDETSFLEASFNFKLNEASNIKAFHSSFQTFESNQSYEKTKFDHIVSNPPYFQNSTKSTSEKLKCSKHDESLSFKDFWISISNNEHEKSKVSVVLPVDESKLFLNYGNELGYYLYRSLEISSKKGSPIKRVLMELRKEKPDEPFISSMYLHNPGQHNYSNEYKELTKEFYLKF